MDASSAGRGDAHGGPAMTGPRVPRRLLWLVPLFAALVFGAVLAWGDAAPARAGDSAAAGAGADAIGAGEAHTCALKDGSVWCWGAPVGLDSSSVPVKVSDSAGFTNSGVSAISVGGLHTCAVKDGGAWCWGGNGFGNLGDGTTTDSSVPVSVSGLASGVSAISAGRHSTCAVKDGAVSCWGRSRGPELCTQHQVPCNTTPVAVAGLASGVTAISMGWEFHTCALKDSSVWCWGSAPSVWGSNYWGQLGDGTTTDSSVPVKVSDSTGFTNSGVSAISAGDNHTCAVKDGGAWCWGYNVFGKFGNGVTFPTAELVPVASGLSSGVSAIIAGIQNTCAVQDGAAWCWGKSSGGSQLCTGVGLCDAIPIAVSGLSSGVTAISGKGTGDLQVCALKDGGAWCWGRNVEGQLGDGTTTDSPVPVAVVGLPSGGVSAISAGSYHTCALEDAGAWCWGNNSYGQLGDGTTTGPDACWLGLACSTTPLAVSGLGSGVSAISAGGDHTCALKDGGVWCWGANDNGALGNGSDTGPQFCWGLPRCHATPVAVPGMTSGVTAISAGTTYTCALKDGGVWCWGGNDSGELGDGTTTPRYLPVAVAGMASGVTAITTSWGSTCAVKNGGAWCWGSNSSGRLGIGTSTGPETCTEGSVVWECSTAPVAVAGMASGVTAIVAGGHHICALKGGGAWCWGRNINGELGDGGDTGPETCSGQSNVWACSTSPVAVAGMASGVTAISAGFSHTCALKDGGAWCWGGNSNGELGDGTTTQRHAPVAVTGLVNGVSAISTFSVHTCALKDGGAACWGRNQYGQLGNNTTTDSNVPVAVWLADADADGMPDLYEEQHICLDATANDALGDPDADSLNNLAEYSRRTNPCSPDSDADGMPDAYEVARSCLNAVGADAGFDGDLDGFDNSTEYTAGTDPCEGNLPTDRWFVALDCGNGPGVDCDVYVGSGPLDVTVKFGNPSIIGGPTNVAGFNINVFNPNAGLLGVGVGVPTKDPSLAQLTECAWPPADDDAAQPPAPGGKTFGPGTADSFLGCFDPTLVGHPMAPESLTTLGTLHYNVAPASAPGAVPLTLWSADITDDTVTTIVNCESNVVLPAPPLVADPHCVNVTINVLPIPDADSDGVPDASDNCVSIANPNQANRNAEIIPLPKPLPPFDDTTNIIGDNVGDACEADIDHDGVVSSTETGLGLSPYIADTDGDRTNDGTEIACGSGPLNALSKLTGTDTDHDGLPDACEVIYGTDPNNIDSDGDRLLDGWEVRYWTSNALSTNTDADGCTDEREVASVNNDAKVNSTDMLMLAQRFGSITPEWGDLDMNGDGKINSTDMLFVAQHFGQCRGT